MFAIKQNQSDLSTSGLKPKDADAKATTTSASATDTATTTASVTAISSNTNQTKANDSKGTDVLRDEKIKEQVRKTYGNLAKTNSAGQACGTAVSCCGAPAETDINYSKLLGYSAEEATCVPLGANLGLGCGNPHAFASLKAGEVVLDLGSGAGFDCFLASKKVGNTGKIIGVDMTPNMLTKARANAVKGGYTNVEFRLGEIEALPVADGSVDVIISNCVVNLSTNKAKVFQEAARVLKPGGRLAIMDTVATAPLPQSLREDLELHSGCMAGATPIEELKAALQAAGFEHVSIVIKEESRSFIKGWAPTSGAENYVASATIKAKKPALKLEQTATATATATADASTKGKGDCCATTCCNDAAPRFFK